MKQLTTLITLLLLFSVKGFNQKISETYFGIGVNKLQSTSFTQYYDEECSPPTFFNLGVSHAWYQTNKKIAFNKEIGLNLQYSSPDLSSGGLGAHNYSHWKLINLFAEATIQAKFKIDSLLSIGFGPAAEYLIIGYNKVNTSYYYLTNAHYENGVYSHSGINRDYLGNSLLGVRFSIFNSGISERATLKVNLSYFWMKQNESNFHSSSFVKIGLAIGLKHIKKDKYQRNKMTHDKQPTISAGK
jgi:hypothetical protein